ncbi:MAG: hypothetical protein QM811_07630 [Pirellulales bacterium]
MTVKRFNSASLYVQRTVASSDPSVLDVSSSGTPDLGSYQFTPLRVATAQQLQSSSFTSTSTPIGAGTLKFRFGGFIDSGVSLDTLNAGAGFTAGKIRVTDRSGATADIDLTTARGRRSPERDYVEHRRQSRGDGGQRRDPLDRYQRWVRFAEDRRTGRRIDRRLTRTFRREHRREHGHRFANRWALR